MCTAVNLFRSNY